MNNYNQYIMTKNEKLKHGMIAAAALFAVGCLFFSNLLLAALMALGAIWYPRYKSLDLARRRKNQLRMQFKDVLNSLSSSLGAGQSLENAFVSALRDLKVLYAGETVDAIRELEHICRRLDLNEPVEAVVLDLAKRSGLDDINDFAAVILICKRTGGDMVQVVKNTANIIGEKLDIVQDMETLLSKQKYEQKLLNFMPVIFIALLKFGGSGYMSPLYQSAQGYLLMFLSLVILAVSFLVSKNITDITV